MKKLLWGMALAALCFTATGLADVYAAPAQSPYKTRSNDTSYNTVPPATSYSSSDKSGYVSRRMTLHLSYKDANGYYEGQVNSQGLPDGRGRFTTTYTNDTNRWMYEGEFRNGHFEGQGRVTDLDDSKVWREGPFTNDELTGYGKMGKNSRVLFEGYFQRDIPLEREYSLPYPVRYSNWEFYINDIYEDNYLGHVRANGKFIILLTKARNLTNLYVYPITTPGLVRLWDRRSGNIYKVATDVMKHYYNDYGNTNWMTERMDPNSTTGTIALTFEVPYYVDNRDLTLMFYAGGDSIAQPYSINIR